VQRAESDKPKPSPLIVHLKDVKEVPIEQKVKEVADYNQAPVRILRAVSYNIYDR
jgi:hypothetical protein